MITMPEHLIGWSSHLLRQHAAVFARPLKCPCWGREGWLTLLRVRYNSSATTSGVHKALLVLLVQLNLTGTS